MLKAYYTFRRFEEESQRYREVKSDRSKSELEKKIRDKSSQDNGELITLLESLGLKKDGAVTKVDREKTFYRFSSEDIDLFYENNFQFIEKIIEETATFVFMGDEMRIDEFLNNYLSPFLRERGYTGAMIPW
ncbi:MAG: hypothetical protein ABIA37_00660 [Candidatus Woesearchaeota archaeon]